MFAALIADRPYRKAFDINTAIRLLIDEVKNFDMRVFLAFQSVVHTQSTLEELEEIEGMDGKTHLQKMPLTAEIQNIK